MGKGNYYYTYAATTYGPFTSLARTVAAAAARLGANGTFTVLRSAGPGGRFYAKYRSYAGGRPTALPAATRPGKGNGYGYGPGAPRR